MTSRIHALVYHLCDADKSSYRRHGDNKGVWPLSQIGSINNGRQKCCRARRRTWEKVVKLADGKSNLPAFGVRYLINLIEVF